MSRTNDFFLSYKRHKFPLSESEYETIQEVLRIKKEGNSFTIVPHEKYLTTQEAADLLNSHLAPVHKYLTRLIRAINSNTETVKFYHFCLLPVA